MRVIVHLDLSLFFDPHLLMMKQLGQLLLFVVMDPLIWKSWLSMKLVLWFLEGWGLKLLGMICWKEQSQLLLNLKDDFEIPIERKRMTIRPSHLSPLQKWKEL